MKLPKYMILAQGGTGAARDRVTNALKANNVGYWHLHADVWFVSGTNQTTDCAAVIAWLRKTAGEEVYWLVVRGDDSGEWAGYGPPETFEWFQKSWHGNSYDKLAALR